MLMSASVAYRSISASSSSVKSSLSRAATFASNCSTLDAPISAAVIRGSRSVQAIASCASVWPRRAAISFSAQIFASDWSLIRSGESEPRRLALEPFGIPSRYLSVSIP